MLDVGSIQDSFNKGQDSLLIPIQQLPMQVVPGSVYFSSYSARLRLFSPWYGFLLES